MKKRKPKKAKKKNSEKDGTKMKKVRYDKRRIKNKI